MSTTLTTPRLLLRRLTMDDVGAMHAIFSDAETMQYWSRLPHSDVAETEDWIARTIVAVDAGEADDFAVWHDGVLIGRAGLWLGNELGVIFARSAWGHGFAREAIEAVIARARGRRVPSIMADIDPRNERIAALLQRLGFVETGRAKNTFQLGDIWTDSVYLRLDLTPPLA